MDFIKKNKFWIANFILAAASIGVFFYATAVLSKATAARVSAIKQSVSSGDGVMKVSAEEGVVAHPNASTEAGMNEKLESLSDSVLAAWKMRYEDQRKIMEWPKEILHGAAGDEFILQFDRYQPPETLPAEEKGQSTNMKRLLEFYQRQIPSQMKNIAAIIRSDWKYQEELDQLAFLRKDTEKSPDADPAGIRDKEKDADKDKSPPPKASNDRRQIVTWSTTNQELWKNKLTAFTGRDDNEFSTQLPSPSQVYMLQQDLWLLEAMFEIIRMVNARMDDQGRPMMGSDDRPRMVLANDLAAIKHIDHVVFGREALSLLGEIHEPDAPKSESGGIGTVGDRQPRGGGGAGSTESDAALTYKGQPAFHGRYVNANFEPIQADAIRKVLTEKMLPAENLELMVARRVPVRLAVQMDERRIPDFLAACANSPFAFEVWQVRINKHDPKEEIKLRGSEGGTTGGEGRPGSGGGKGRDVSGIGQQGGGSGTGFSGGGTGGGAGQATSGAEHVALRRDYDVGVEFYGVVKIYNPPDDQVLNGETNPPTGP